MVSLSPAGKLTSALYPLTWVKLGMIRKRGENTAWIVRNGFVSFKD